MKNKWVKIILIASLAFNLAFISTAIYKKFFVKTKKIEREIKFEDKLQIKDMQREEMNLISKKFNINYIKFKQDILEKRMEIIEELSDPEPNFENIEKLTAELNEMENQLNTNFVDTLAHINSILDSKQRLNFLYKLSKNWFFMENNKGGTND